MRAWLLRTLDRRGVRPHGRVRSTGSPDRPDFRGDRRQGRRRGRRRAAGRHRVAVGPGDHGRAQRGDEPGRPVSVPGHQPRVVSGEVRAGRLRDADPAGDHRRGADHRDDRQSDEDRRRPGNHHGHRRVPDRRRREPEGGGAVRRRAARSGADRQTDLQHGDAGAGGGEFAAGPGRHQRDVEELHGRARRQHVRDELFRRHGGHAAELRPDVLRRHERDRRAVDRHRGDGRRHRRRRRRQHQRRPEIGEQPVPGAGRLRLHPEVDDQQQCHARADQPRPEPDRADDAAGRAHQRGRSDQGGQAVVFRVGSELHHLRGGVAIPLPGRSRHSQPHRPA